MTLRLEIKGMKDWEAVRLITMIMKTIAKCDVWKHDDDKYSIDYNRDDEKKTERTGDNN